MWWTAPTLRHRRAIGWLGRNATTLRRAVHGQGITIGVDVAKSGFQIHGIYAQDTVVTGGVLVEREFSSSLPICRLAALVWRRAQQRISGHASSRSWGMTHGSCHRPMSKPM